MKQHSPKRMSKPLDQVRAMILYQQGLTDKEIAEKLDSTCYSVQKWRLNHGMTANRRIGEMRGGENTLIRDCREAARLGLSYGQYKARQHDGDLRRAEREAAIFAARRKRKEARDAGQGD